MQFDSIPLDDAILLARQGDAILRGFYDSVSLMMGVVQLLEEPPGDILHVRDNAACAAFFGVQPGFTDGKTASSIGAPREVIDLWMGYYRQSRTQGGPVRFEYEHHTPPGPRWLSVTVCPVLESAGPQCGSRFCYVAEDVTERKAAERTLQRQKAYLREVINLNPSLIYARDSEGRYTLLNRASAEFTGLPVEDMLGRTDVELWKSPEAAEEFMKTDREVLRTQSEVVIEEGLVTDHQGQVHRLRTVKRPISGPDGKRQILGVSTDITQIKQIEAELRQAKESAESATLAKSRFLANMSHEIRTPMTAILGYADLLASPEHSPEAKLEFVQTIRRNGEHLLAVINDILDHSKIEAGKMTLEPIACSPARIVSEVETLMRVRAVEKGIGFAVEFRDGVPPAVVTDPLRLRQVLLNLVSNAVKFTSTGEVKIIIEPGAADQTLKFTVSDTGVGIALDEQEGLFQTFSQADSSTTRRFGGTGLGLAICRRLVEMLGGQIDLRSEPGRGSRFEFTIAARAGTMLEPASPPVTPATLHGRVLLAEDGMDNQRLIGLYLAAVGLKVETAANGQIALDMIESARRQRLSYDAVLMDMQMPVLDGYATTAELRRRSWTALPIIAFTAHAMSGDREKCQEAGCDDYITKPIDPQALIQTLARHLPSAGPVRSLKATDAIVGKILHLFVAELPGHVRQSQRGLQEGDWPAAQRTAHQLKGAGGGYGFPRITQLAAALEEAARSGRDQAAMRSAAQALIDHLQRIDGYRSGPAEI